MKKTFIFLQPAGVLNRSIDRSIKTYVKGAGMVSKIKYYIQAAIESFPINNGKKEKLLEVIKVKISRGDK